MQVDDAAALIVQRIFTRRWQGQTLTQIADELNRDGVKTGRGRNWHASVSAKCYLTKPITGVDGVEILA
ncbi:MAG: recombinase family protein [Candidatus Promineifilaceae bacterium]